MSDPVRKAEPLVWFELRCFTGNSDTDLDQVIELDESQVAFHPNGSARHPGEGAITINLSGEQMRLAKETPSLVQRSIDETTQSRAESKADLAREAVKAFIRSYDGPGKVTFSQLQEYVEPAIKVAIAAYEAARAKLAVPLTPDELLNALVETARANPNNDTIAKMMRTVSDPMPPLGDGRRPLAVPAAGEPSNEALRAIDPIVSVFETALNIEEKYALASLLDAFRAAGVAAERERCIRIAVKMHGDIVAVLHALNT